MEPLKIRHKNQKGLWGHCAACMHICVSLPWSCEHTHRFWSNLTRSGQEYFEVMFRDVKAHQGISKRHLEEMNERRLQSLLVNRSYANCGFQVSAGFRFVHNSSTMLFDSASANLICVYTENVGEICAILDIWNKRYSFRITIKVRPSVKFIYISRLIFCNHVSSDDIISA
jgi:hypothetical protein